MTLESSGKVIPSDTVEIGDSISYTTTLNGVTLDDWKVFYIDGDYTYLIYGDYLPNSAVSDTIKTNYNLTNGNGDYSIKSTTNRKDLIDAMTTTSNWSSLLTGTLNGTAIDYRSSQDQNIKAMGSPTLELYVNSWNAKHPDNEIYIVQSEETMSDGYNGYYAENTENPITYIDRLYYPHNARYENCYGYWLASPSTSIIYGMMIVRYDSYEENDIYSYKHDGIHCAFRPVVCLPSNIF